MEVVNKVRELVNEPITKLGYHLDDVLYEKENNMYFLRIVIDKDGFVGLEDCVAVSNLVNPMLDKTDLIKEQYILDVCSKEKGSE
jgi:ribosome maturation factor RimP